MKTIQYRYHGPASGLSVSVRKPGADPVLFETLLHDGKNYTLPADVAATDEVKVLVELKYLELVVDEVANSANSTNAATSEPAKPKAAAKA